MHPSPHIPIFQIYNIEQVDAEQHQRHILHLGGSPHFATFKGKPSLSRMNSLHFFIFWTGIWIHRRTGSCLHIVIDTEEAQSVWYRHGHTQKNMQLLPRMKFTTIFVGRKIGTYSQGKIHLVAYLCLGFEINISLSYDMIGTYTF